MGLENLFGALAKEALNPAASPTGSFPFGIDRRPMPPGDAIDQLVPPMVGGFTRGRVNDRFGGPRSGGVFATYGVDGVAVQVLASLARSPAAAREQVTAAARGGEDAGVPPATAQSLGTEPSFSAAPGSMIWSRGPYWFSASSHDTEGDVGLPATPAQIAALERFLSAFPY